MKAMVIDKFGGPELIRVGEMPEPAPGEHDLLIEVHATAVNPVDIKIRTQAVGLVQRTFPLILGYDVSGIVRGMGAKVQGFKVGDAVYASPSLARPGACAEMVCADARAAAHKPGKLDHVQAAALPLVTLTAWEALHKRVGIHKGQTVLIHAGAGGVGHIAVQLAKIQGCKVITTASREESIALCKKLGADEVINYAKEDFVGRVQALTGGAGLPVIFDTVGGEVFVKSLDCVAINGQIVTILGADTSKVAEKLFRKNASLHFEFMGAPTVFGIAPDSQGQILQTVAELVDAGRVQPHVSKVMPLEELAEAHRLQQSGHVVGKIVLKVR